MPTTSSSRISTDADEWERTILFPEKEHAGDSESAEPKAGTSLRRQFLIQTTGTRRRLGRILEFPAEISEFTFGKSQDCRGRVEAPGIADLHAAFIRRVNRGVYLVDLSEGARTLLNGEPVREEVLLMDGDRITLGESVHLEYLDGPRPKGWAKRVLSSATRIRPRWR